MICPWHSNILIIQRFVLTPKMGKSCLYINRVPLREWSIIDCASQSYRSLAGNELLQGKSEHVHNHQRPAGKPT